MSKPDLDIIIQSPEAETFLGMVTKGFYSNSYTGLWIYEVIGREWDEMREWAEGLQDEIHPQTCTWSVPIWEWVYGIEPDETLPLAYRRQRILSKIVGVKPINPEVIRRGVTALIGGTDGEVEVNDFVEPYRFEVILHPSGKNPLNYAKIFTYIREIKPSHLAFEAAIETKVDITIEVDTSWNLVGFGLTNQYPCGTRPNINVKAQLHDLLVTVDIGELAAAIQPDAAGTVFASGSIENPQRMNPPSTVFQQTQTGVGVEIGGGGYAAKAPPASEESVTGQYPHTAIKGGTADTGVTAEIAGDGYPFTADPAGTKPDPQTLFHTGGAVVTAEIGASGYAAQADPAGTKPQEATKLAHRSVEVATDIGADAYSAQHPATKAADSEAGRHPAPQIRTAAGQAAISPEIGAQGYEVAATPTGTKPQTHQTLGAGSGGVTIETDSYTVAFRMCGTDVTRES